MKSYPVLNKSRSVFLIGWLLLICFGSLLEAPVYAAGPFLSINVSPSNISFNIADAEKPEEYYTGNQKVTVVSRHTFPWLRLRWYLGIRSAEAYLKDSINPDNRIPISQLRWSKEEQDFKPLSEQWVLVNSYFDFCETSYQEEIKYRLYPEPDQILPAGLYSARIEFDTSWAYLPWR